MGNIFKKAREKISSLFSFGKFDWEFYDTLNLEGQQKYLSDKRNRLSKDEYFAEIKALKNKQRYYEVRNKEEEGNNKTPSSFRWKIDNKNDLWEYEIEKLRNDIKEERELTEDKLIQNYGWDWLETADHYDTYDPKTAKTLHKHYKILQQQKKEKRIEEMNEGCILLVTNTMAVCTPLIEEMGPHQFRYRMTINKLLKVNSLEEFRSMINDVFPFVDLKSVSEDSKIENYFPLDFRNGYSGRFCAKWLFIKNISDDTIMIYLKSRIGNERTFVSIKPGGVMTFLYGDMLNSSAYIDDVRLPNDHPFIEQYRNKTHSEIKDN